MRAHEDVTDVTIVTLAISRHESGHHHAKIVAKVLILFLYKVMFQKFAGSAKKLFLNFKIIFFRH